MTDDVLLVGSSILMLVASLVELARRARLRRSGVVFNGLFSVTSLFFLLMGIDKSRGDIWTWLAVVGSASTFVAMCFFAVDTLRASKKKTSVH